MKLKPCPFCGSTMTASMIRRVGSFGDNIDEIYIECRVCFATGGYKITEDEAWKTWNTRAEPKDPCHVCGVERGINAKHGDFCSFTN